MASEPRQQLTGMTMFGFGHASVAAGYLWQLDALGVKDNVENNIFVVYLGARPIFLPGRLPRCSH